jgi:hypothetical protein
MLDCKIIYYTDYWKHNGEISPENQNWDPLTTTNAKVLKV